MKKLIIVTGLIMLAACSNVRKGTIPSEGTLSPVETQDQLILSILWYQQPAQMKALYYQCFRNAENIVYLELLARGYKVHIGKLYEREIDFLAVKESNKIYIRVAYLLSDETVIEKELGALESVRDNYPKLVLSMDNYFGNVRNGIRWQNLVDFLLTS